MSLDIWLSYKDTEIASMNWLRNPFGLEYWARMNVAYATREAPLDLPMDLYDVINTWNYDKGDQVDRPLFKQVVDAYGAVIRTLPVGYFWFTETALRQFVQGNTSHIPARVDLLPDGRIRQIEGAVTHGDVLGIPQQYFGDPIFHLADRYRPTAHTLERYQAWYAELEAFAEQLQDPNLRFYCSN